MIEVGILVNICCVFVVWYFLELNRSMIKKRCGYKGVIFFLLVWRWLMGRLHLVVCSVWNDRNRSWDWMQLLNDKGYWSNFCMSPPQQESFNSGNKQPSLICLWPQWAVLMLDLQNQAAYAIEMKVFALKPAVRSSGSGSRTLLWWTLSITSEWLNVSLLVEAFCILQFGVICAAEILLALSPPQCHVKQTWVKHSLVKKLVS